MRELIDIVTAPAGPGAGAAGGSVLAREISFVNSFVRDGNRERKRKRLGGGEDFTPGEAKNTHSTASITLSVYVDIFVGGPMRLS